MSQKIRVQFRWSPELYEEERQAEEIRQHYHDQGIDDRRLFTEALLALEGTKIKERNSQRAVMAKLSRIERKIDDQTEMNALIVEALQSMDLGAFIDPHTQRSMADELGGRLSGSVYSQMFTTVQGEAFED